MFRGVRVYRVQAHEIRYLQVTPLKFTVTVGGENVFDHENYQVFRA